MAAREIEFKTSVALALSGLDVSAKVLQSLVGREKPPGQHHMKYTPADLRAARYRHANLDPAELDNSLLFAADKLPPQIITRMTRGGAGKSSISVNVAATLAMMGYRTLLIDADPQATASNMLGVESAYDATITHLGKFLTRATNTPDADLPQAILPIYANGFLSLLPSDITLSETDAALVATMASHERVALFLSRNVRYLSQNFEVIVFDTAPGTTPIGLACTYAGKSAGKILAVVEPEGSCLRALDSLASNLTEINMLTRANVDMEVVVNRYHPSIKHVRENMGLLYSKYGTKLLDVIIPQYSGFGRQINPASGRNAPLVELEPSSPGGMALIELTKALIQSYRITLPGMEPKP
ncbi:ParA family protein [Sulfuricystis multivorans]|uniref:ParA family protein n=1 Tax=Sulfuricystis multivorans TaxID=2211108 RepID=UPI000F833127|nr:ParA family protein [Sulfuricystis multivorans]